MNSQRQRIEFRSLSKTAIRDASLRRALRKATDTTNQKRVQAFQYIQDRDQLRETASAIRREVIDNLAGYVDEFSRNATRAGSIVHRAPDGESARTIIAGILRDRGVKRAVKSKSMISEEIELNDHLRSCGIRVVETDLGEYIVQLAGERPSHITAPAIHKSRKEIGRLFSQRLGLEYSDDPTVLTAMAGRALRQEFFDAQAGISGANFALADLGSLVLFTNEGNGRMVTTLPRLHIAVLSLEKIIPSLNHLPVFMALLPRSATGQPITSYVSIITGRKRTGELSGPDEIHIVLLDNRRSQIAASDYRDILKCIRCGACMNVCPVYGVVGGHCYGSTYGGPMGIILTILLEGMERSHSLADASTLCGACVEVCPVKVPLVGLITQLRQSKTRQKLCDLVERIGMTGFGLVSEIPLLYRFGHRLLGSAGWSGLKKVLGPESQLQRLPTPDRTPLHRRLP